VNVVDELVVDNVATVPVGAIATQHRRKRPVAIKIEMDTIRRDKRRKLVVNQTVSRSYRFVFDKGVIMDDSRVLPFGHRDAAE
jgi:hypothetical protein